MGSNRNFSLTYIVAVVVALLATGCNGPSKTSAAAAESTATTSQALSTFVQNAGCLTDGCNPFMTFDFPSRQTAGDLNVVFVGWADTTKTVSSITDTAGNTYTLAVTGSAGAGVWSQSIYYAKNIVAAAHNSVTVTFNGGTQKLLRAAEYSGLSTTTPLDVAATAAGSGTSLASGPMTTTASNDLVIVGTAGFGCVNTASAGFTQRLSEGCEMLEDQVDLTPGSITVDSSQDDNGFWLQQMAAFKAAASQTPTYVQGMGDMGPQPAITFSLAAPGAQAAGDLNLVVVDWAEASATIASVTDTAGNTYTSVAPATKRTGFASQQIFYAKNIAGAATNKLNVNFAASTAFPPTIRLLEYSGLDSVSPVDGFTGSSGKSVNATSGPVTTTLANDLVVVASLTGECDNGPGTGFTSRDTTDCNLVEDEIATTAGSYSATVKQSSNTAWIQQMVGLKQATGGGGPCQGLADGTICNDGNACTQTDTCQSGVCTGSNPVTCTASDPCHVAGTCNTSTGACSNPVATNGTTCSDGSACTQTDTCQNGTCIGGNSVICTASDQCHVSGTCNPSTGACSNPVATNGTTCSDGNACTQTDTCQSGVCTGGNTVTCTASDQCHTAGTCNSSTGVCSNPVATNGTTCSDGNACTLADTCQSGVCAGSGAVTCTASDQCHTAGTCDPGTGACSNPVATNGTTCSDGNACTLADSCQSGICTGSSSVTCTASDQCHAVGTCDPSTGVCSNPVAANGTVCNDGNGCTTNDTCTSGSCTGTSSCSVPVWPPGSALAVRPLGPTSAVLSWNAASDPTGIASYRILDNFEPIATVNGNTLSFNATGLATGAQYQFTVQASNADGAFTTNGPSATYTSNVPDPSTVAPALDSTVATTVAAASAFLYRGTDPIQSGVTATIDPRRVAVAQGFVIDTTGTPITGVLVRVADHPEFGQTTTRADGRYDLVVNGGGSATLTFDATAFLHAERTVQLPWSNFVHLDDVALVMRDTQITSVDLSGGGATQVARGSMVQDAIGARRATLVFASGTSAQMAMPNGQQQPLATVHVRATEFTVGGVGPAAMPAALPATSGYTYALALTIDEAEQAGAKQVTFSSSVAVFVENFLNEKVGVVMPAGYYDTATHQWIPAKDGRVVEVLSTASGSASLDVDGIGQPASASELAQLGVTADELTQLAQLYTAGQTLWRVPVSHFSLWDFNQETAPPPDATAPNVPSPHGGTGGGSDDDHTCPGCIIEEETQVLGERLSIKGTPFSINYRSSRTPGYRDISSLSIPLTTTNPPSSLLGVVLNVEVAGRFFTQQFGPGANQTYTFVWDGTDAYGRHAQGVQPVTVKIGYEYPAVYLAPSDEPNFTNYDQEFGHYTYFGAPATTTSTPIAGRVITLWNTWTSSLGHWTESALGTGQDGLGGWTISPHIIYDLHNLYYGDGRRRASSSDAFSFPWVAELIGGGASRGYTGDNGPALQASFDGPTALAVAADGSIFVVDQGNHLIRKIDSGGVVTTVAGNENFGFAGDGGPASSAVFDGITSISVGPNGDLYIADSGNARIRRIDPNGTINTVAGTGTCGGSVDGVPALSAQLCQANDGIGVAAAPDGSVYIQDSGFQPVVSGAANGRIMRMSTDGFIRIVTRASTLAAAGNGVPLSQAHVGPNQPNLLAVDESASVYLPDGFFLRQITPDGVFRDFAGNGSTSPIIQDGVLATSTFAEPGAMASMPDNSIVYFDAGLLRLRRVSPNGMVTTLAGGGASSPLAVPQHQMASELSFLEDDTFLLAAAPDGSIVTAHGVPSVIYRLRPPLPSLADSLPIAEADGSKVFIFDAQGRHQKTVDALSNATLYSFGYDTAGRLASISDAYGNMTTLERDPNGTPTAIVGPYGEATTLTLDSNGYLASVTDPVGNAAHFTYDANGLLQTTTSPRGASYRYSYDPAGRLLTDVDPVGGGSTLSNGETAVGNVVTQTTAMGVSMKFELDQFPSGTQQHVVVGPDGLSTTLVQSQNNETSTLPDGTKMTTTLGSDPRFGSQAPIQTSVAITTPGGLTFRTGTSVAVTLANAADPFSVVSATRTSTLSGKSWTSTFNAAAKTVVTTSPLGRQQEKTFDANGNVTVSSVPGRAPIQRTYDALGRLQTISQSGLTWTIGYDTQGYTNSVTDPAGIVTATTKDASGRSTTMLLPDGRDGTRTLLAGYNSDDDLTSLTLPGGAQHTLSYTPVDALESYAPPALGTGNVVTQYEYDADGRVELETRPDGATIAYGYDNAGRLHTTTYPQGMITRGYDPTTGKLASIASPSGVSLAFGYDGILAKSTTWSGTVTGSVLLGYDATFRTTSQVLNGGAALSFGYDDDNLMTQAGALTLTRDPQSGRVTGSTLGSTADAYTYDANGMFANYTARFSGTVVYSESVGARDNVGRITQRTEIAGGATHVWGYSYDTAGRLMDVTEDGTAVSHYEYDADDNRITFTNASGTVHPVYDAQDRLLTYGNATYTYGANGELESKEVGGQTTTYEYDVFGNLLHVDSPSGSVLDYIIDGQNRRVGKKVGGVLTAGFLYQEPLKVVAQLDPSGSVAARFVFGTKANVPDYFTSAAGTFRILSDHLGSPRMIVDVSTGSVVEEIDYDEFGNVTNDTAPGTIPFGFGGGFFDKDAALVRFGARDYDPGTGRWTAKDPSRFAGGTNLYGYAVNDPINGIDPSGLYVVFIGIGAEATVGAGGGGSIGAYFDTDIFNIWNPSTWASGAGLYISGQLSFGLDVGAGVCGGVTKDQSTFFGKGYGVGAAGPTYGADVLFTPVDGPVDAEGNQMAGGTPTGGQISRGFAGFGVSGLPAGAHVFISGTAPLLQ